MVQKLADTRQRLQEQSGHSDVAMREDLKDLDTQSEEYSQHPYLAGNFRPVRKEFDLQPCELVVGYIPSELAGGQYIRNGANAYFPAAPGEGYHL